MPKKRFLRRVWSRYSKLGRNRKKKQKWRRPKGRDNKMREKRRGYMATVRIGYRGNKEKRGKINGKEIAVIFNKKELLEANERNRMIMIGKTGRKNKIILALAAKEKGIKIHNLNIDRFLQDNPIKGGKK